MEPITVQMKWTKATKGTHVYSSESEIVPTLYIKKEALPKVAPLEITLTIEVKK